MHEHPAAPAPATATGGLAARLRGETTEVHEAAERAPFVQDLLAGRLPVGEYARLARQHHAIYTTLEALVAANSEPTLEPFLDPALTRLPALEADLVTLVGSDWRRQQPVLASTQAYCEHLDQAVAEWPRALLAHHYVRYLGDLSGGQLIGRILQRTYGFEGDAGTEFYRFPGLASPKAFKDRYRTLLDTLPWDAADQQRLLDEVIEAYRHNGDVLHELAPLPLLAVEGHARARRPA